MRQSVICLILALAIPVTAAHASPAITIIEDAVWSPGDATREGAAELGVMLRVAQLQHEHRTVGLVGIGDKRGLFQEGTRRGLEFAVQHGVPVVRLARGRQVCLNGTDDLFIDGGILSPEAASELLSECLVRHGPLPICRAGAGASAGNLHALRHKLQLYQAEFTARQPALVAAR